MSLHSLAFTVLPGLLLGPKFEMFSLYKSILKTVPGTEWVLYKNLQLCFFSLTPRQGIFSLVYCTQHCLSV